MPPRIMIVSDWRFQHSPMFGQDALSQTVCSPSSATRFLRSKKTSPARHLHPDPGRLRLDLRAGVGGAAPGAFSLEDAEAARAGFDDAGGHFGWWNLPPGSMLRWAGYAAGVKLAGGGRHRRDSVRPRAARPRRAWPRKQGRAELRLGSRGGVPPGTLRGGRGEVRGGLCPHARSRAALQRGPVVPAGGQQAARARAVQELRPPLSRRCQRGGRPGPRRGAEEGRRGPAARRTTGQPDAAACARARVAGRGDGCRRPSRQPAPTRAAARWRRRRRRRGANASVPLLSRPAPAPADTNGPLTQQTWFWVAVGAAVAVVGTMVILLASRGETFPEPTFGTARGN